MPEKSCDSKFKRKDRIMYYRMYVLIKSIQQNIGMSFSEFVL